MDEKRVSLISTMSWDLHSSKRSFESLGLTLLKKEFNGREDGTVVFRFNREGALEVFYPENRQGYVFAEKVDTYLLLKDPALEITPKILAQRCLMMTYKAGKLHCFEHPSSVKVATESFDARREKAALAAQEKANTPS